MLREGIHLSRKYDGDAIDARVRLRGVAGRLRDAQSSVSAAAVARVPDARWVRERRPDAREPRRRRCGRSTSPPITR